MDKDKVMDLAKLARIEIDNEEVENLSHEFEDILNYVGEVRRAGIRNKELRIGEREKFPLRNVLRADAESHEPGIYTQKLLAQAPAREGDYIKVRRIL